MPKYYYDRMASPGGLVAPPIVITLIQGDDMGDKMTTTLFRALLAYHEEYINKNSSTPSDSILILHTVPWKVLQGHKTAPLRLNTPIHMQNRQDAIFNVNFYKILI